MRHLASSVAGFLPGEAHTAAARAGGLAAQAPDGGSAAQTPGTAAAFWIFGVIAVLAAVGMVAVRRAVHSALMLALVMLCLAGLYAVQQAPFLAFVQVIVYTGAVVMLFLFVVMLVGVESYDSLAETIRGQRLWVALAGLGFVVLFIGGLGNVATRPAAGLGQANAGGNVESLAQLMFTKYVFAFEATAALLITAAVGAMVLTHREVIVPAASQREMATRRFRAPRPNALPNPGVYARHNAVDMPGLLPDGSSAPESVPAVVSPQRDEQGEPAQPPPPVEGEQVAVPPAEDGELDRPSEPGESQSRDVGDGDTSAGDTAAGSDTRSAGKDTGEAGSR